MTWTRKSRGLIFNHFIANTNNGEVDVDRVVSKLSYFTPADIEYLFHKVSHFAFEKELKEGRDYRTTTETFLEIIPDLQAHIGPIYTVYA